MITKEQIEEGCEIWLASVPVPLNVSLYRDDIQKSSLFEHCYYFASKYEAELHVLECRLNDN